MPVDVSQHPDYAVKSAAYRTEKQAALTAADEVAQAKAEANWQGQLSMMTADMYERADQERGRQAKVAEIKLKYPAAPPSIFELRDLEQMERAAGEVQAVANQSAQRTGTPPAGGTWSPPPGSGATGSPEVRPEDMTAEQAEQFRVKRMRELAPVVLKKGRLAQDEADELMRLSLAPLADRFQGGGEQR